MARPLKPEDARHVTAAQGYVELGLLLEADAKRWSRMAAAHAVSAREYFTASAMK
jgi:hypothetical protein